MAEGTFKSYDPLAYKVNNISDLDNKIVLAHRNKDQQKIKSILTDDNKQIFNVYICVNSGWHAFVLCIPFNENSDPLGLLDFAALRASPNRYNVLLDDCVEFAKEFCLCLLSYCSNYKLLEEQVETNIKRATASGLSVENLSRRVQSSARLGNTFLGGLDMSSLFSGGVGAPIAVVFILVYPVIVSFAVAFTVAFLMQK